MKQKLLFALLTLLCVASSAKAWNELRAYNASTGEKGIYYPSVFNKSGNEYQEGAFSWSMSRKRESANFVVFWDKGYGSTAPDQLLTSDFYYVDIDNLLEKAEEYYALYATTMGFVDPTSSTTMSKYKCMIMLEYSNEWAAYGGGYDFVVPALWINPETCKPVGHTIAHEIGHSFHYMAFAESNNHQDSYTDNTGFHLPCGSGQAIWEQTAQFQAATAEPTEMFNESYPLFGNNANYAFSHEWMRYQSYWFLFYLNQYYNDPATVGKVWNQPMKNQSNDGSATDFCQALMALKGLSASQFYALYFDYALRCATFDFDVAAAYRNNYIGKFDYHAVQLGEKKYQVAYHSAPQSTGFNVIELSVPSSGTTITTKFTALQHGCALNADDPATYNNGVANASVSAGVNNYNSAGSASDRGFRVGYVFLKGDGTRSYYNDNTIHCTGTAEKTENITTTVPANTSRMFLVVAPALSSYVRHPWDDNILNDDQWPYSFELVNTDATNATIVEKAPEEPEFTKVIDGRSIADVTLTYKVTLPVDAEGYTGANVTLNTGNGLNALCTAFQLESSSIFNSSTLVDYTASQSNNTIMSCALTSNGIVQEATHNSGEAVPFGHWFNASGTVASWGNGTVAFTEFADNYATGTIGQYPGANSSGTTRTIREALVYKNSSGQTARATFIYNISFKANASPSAYLTEIDYTKPTGSGVSTTNATVYRAHEAAAISWEVIKGQEATYTLTTGTSSDVSKVTYGLNSITESYLTNSTYFKGYTEVSSVSTGNYVYYYALSQAPTTSSDGFKYYSTASVNTDSVFDTNTYVHYYNASGQVVSAANAADASFKIGYDYKNMKFTVKVKEDCPTGTYTLYLAMLRRVKSSNSTRNYSAYFPITLTVIEKPEETIQVERSAGMGYTTTSVDIDFTAAKEYLGVSTLSTDMLRIVNPDGTLVSDYAAYDGWFNADGVATAWGADARINVKFFQAIPSGTYTICDMNGADVAGTSYTVKWALEANGKTYTFNIVTTFTEKEYASYNYGSLRVISTKTLNLTSQLGQYWEGLTADVDMASILSTLSASSIEDVAIYAVLSNGLLDDMYGRGGTDGYRNADGDWATYGSDESCFYVQSDFSQTETQISGAGGKPGKTDVPVTYTATYAFVSKTSVTLDAVILKVNLIYPGEPIVYNVEIHTQSKLTESLSIPLNDAAVSAFGLTWEDVKTKLNATNTANGGIGVANHTLAADEIMLYPATSDGTPVTTTGLTYNGIGQGHAYGFNAYTTASSLDNGAVAVALDWIGNRWVIHQKLDELGVDDEFDINEVLLYNDGTNTKSQLFKFHITVTEMPSITLKDSYTEYEQQSGFFNVTLERSLPTGKWLTFCAPFNIGAGEWADMGIERVMKLNGVEKSGESITLQFVDVTDGIWVGIPVIIKMAEARTGITMQETPYDPCTAIHRNEYTNGTVTAAIVSSYVKIDLPNDVYYLQDDKFRHTNYTGETKTALKGWRAYFTVTDTGSEVKQLGFRLDDENVVPTDIEGMEVVLNDRVDVYTVAGTKVKSHVQRLNATEGLPAGIYLVGGKKVIVK